MQSKMQSEWIPMFNKRAVVDNAVPCGVMLRRGNEIGVMIDGVMLVAGKYGKPALCRRPGCSRRIANGKPPIHGCEAAHPVNRSDSGVDVCVRLSAQSVARQDTLAVHALTLALSNHIAHTGVHDSERDS